MTGRRSVRRALTPAQRKRLLAELREIREMVADNAACVRALRLHHEARAQLREMRNG